MDTLGVKNPFGAPVYYEETVSSTMDVSRELARQGAAHGTVIAADFQERGRGRQARPWKMERGANLAFTIYLDYPGAEAIPQALTLRTGLAVALGIEAFLPPLAGRILLKWPNDVMIAPEASGEGRARKAAGILSEAEGGRVYTGVGINLAQEDFPPDIRDKAVSLYTACGPEAAALCCPGKAPSETRLILLEKILACLYGELETAPPRSLEAPPGETALPPGGGSGLRRGGRGLRQGSPGRPGRHKPGGRTPHHSARRDRAPVFCYRGTAGVLSSPPHSPGGRSAGACKKEEPIVGYLYNDAH